jgi:hypothetical protein
MSTVPPATLLRVMMTSPLPKMKMASTLMPKNGIEYTEDDNNKYIAANNNNKEYAEEGSLTKH